MINLQSRTGEQLRLKDLDRYGIMDTPPEKDFDQLARLVAQICGCSYAAISFVGKEKQFFKAGVGDIGTETPREVSFCTHTILQDDVMVVEDASLDERFVNSTMVTGPLAIRYYAGAPIVTANGHHLGSVCVFDSKPHVLTKDQLSSLQVVSGQVTRLLELRMINKVIAKEAEQKISRERKALQHTLQEQDRERQTIGIALHENFAQVLAASLMYLNLARPETSADPFFEKAQQALTELLHDMRRMSRTYNPLSLHVAAVEETMDEVLREMSLKGNYIVDFDWTGDAAQIDPRTAENLLHILVQYLKQIAGKTEISEVSVRVKVGEDVRMRIRDNGNWIQQMEAAELSPALDALFRRIEMTSGTYEFTGGRNELTVLKIIMPLAVPSSI